MRRLVIGSVFAALAVLCSPASADSCKLPQPDDPEQAAVHFSRGVELYREGSLDAALAEFSKAYEVSPNYRVLYNLAQIRAEQQDHVKALDLFERYLTLGGEEVPSERVEEVQATMAELRRKVGLLTVENRIAGAELLVDGVFAGVLPLTGPVLVNAGVHQVELRPPGEHALTYTLMVAGAETLHLRLPDPPEPVTPAPLSVPSPPEQQQAERPPRENEPALLPHSHDGASNGNAALWISLVAAGTMAAGTATFAGLYIASDNALDRELERVPADQARVAELRADVKRNAALFDVFAVGTAITSALSVYFALSAPDEQSPSKSDTRLVMTGPGMAVTHPF